MIVTEAGDAAEIAQVGEPGLMSQARPLTREDIASDEFQGLIRNMCEAKSGGTGLSTDEASDHSTRIDTAHFYEGCRS